MAVDLKAANEDYVAKTAAATKAGTYLGTVVLRFDGALDVLSAYAGRYCTSDDDAASLGMEQRTRAKNPLAMPLAVEPRYNRMRDWIRVHVKRAPGMNVVCLEMSPDPITPTSWQERDGTGAYHIVPHPAPGIWWFRAASRTAKGKSEYTTPISVLVK